MRWLFRRRPKGRHALGAAVTEIPSAPIAVPLLPVAPAPLAPQVPPPAIRPPAVAETQAHQGTRVELGFRDGSRAELDPESAQAKALDELAQLLTRRD